MGKTSYFSGRRFPAGGRRRRRLLRKTPRILFTGTQVQTRSLSFVSKPRQRSRNLPFFPFFFLIFIPAIHFPGVGKAKGEALLSIPSCGERDAAGILAPTSHGAAPNFNTHFPGTMTLKTPFFPPIFTAENKLLCAGMRSRVHLRD